MYIYAYEAEVCEHSKDQSNRESNQKFEVTQSTDKVVFFFFFNVRTKKTTTLAKLK